MAAIQTQDLRKTYGAVTALHGLNLTVEKNTIFGFLGPNGAGKTTTIRMLTGLAHPSGGQAWVAGAAIGHSQQAARQIGYLPEEPALYPWMTPAEFLDHVGRLFGLNAPERRSRVDELLDLVGLTETRKRRIGGFSRGMRQRMGLAQALVNRPEVLFLDEPVSALDPLGRKEVLELIESLRGQCTIFMSTHILSDVERVCDTVGIVHKGKLIVKARKDDLLAQYALPILELECDNGRETSLADWSQQLAGQPWNEAVNLEGKIARIMVSDIDTARASILAALAGSGLAVRRFEVVTPSLEDVFLRLVENEEVKA